MWPRPSLAFLPNDYMYLYTYSVYLLDEEGIYFPTMLLIEMLVVIFFLESLLCHTYHW